ncbi:hypothetical protein HFO99_21220 [Rhizobium leguminosarum]|uniref:hypothetical protein n=1 Tax=Rhizobium leguminosarum TaxID=384 RepID=UPI001C9488D1|nr:hypothetical protein [Rhizobium leguminosarum]MBY5336416.1 hypothetical protein [Rhizobium leguminosarum]
MSYKDDEPKGTIFPGVVFLLAMAGLVGALVSMRQSTAPVRVWVPVQSTGSPAGKSTATCSPAWAVCNSRDSI